MNKRQIKKKITRILCEEAETERKDMIKIQLRKKISRILCEAEAEAFDSMIDGDIDEVKYSDGSPVYQDGYGEASFPIRLSSKRQVEEISEYLSDDGYNCYDLADLEEILDQLDQLNRRRRIYRHTYKLWVAFTASPLLCNFAYWGLERVTESPDDTYPNS
jgi:hypothetical protein